MAGTLLIIVLALLVLGAWPSWPYSRTWGYYPTSMVGLILVVIIVLMFLESI